MTGETTFPNLENFQGMRRIVVPSVEDAMPESGANDCRNDDVDEHLVDQIVWQLLLFKHLCGNHVAQPERYCKKETVIAQLERAEMEHHWVNVPVYEAQ